MPIIIKGLRHFLKNGRDKEREFEYWGGIGG